MKVDIGRYDGAGSDYVPIGHNNEPEACIDVKASGVAWNNEKYSLAAPPAPSPANSCGTAQR